MDSYLRSVARAQSLSRREFLRAVSGSGASNALLGFSPLRAMAMPPAPKVVVVTFGGGARDEETFAPEGQQYIPHLLNELIPQATFFTQVVNRGILGHYVATASLATGVYETFNNFAPVAPHRPTIFEYFRRDLKRPANDAWVIAPSNGFNRIGESDHALYGGGLGAHVVLPKHLLNMAMGGGTGGLDHLMHDNYESAVQVPLSASAAPHQVHLEELAKIMQLSMAEFLAHARAVSSPDELSLYIAQQVMRQLAPSLLWVTLHDIDIAHAGAYSLYTEAVRRSDRLCGELWRTIQANPEYKGRTTMFILPDFGRDADGDAGGNGFQHHRTGDPLSRTTWMMVLGHGIRENVTVDRMVEPVDLVPTLGRVLGCNARFAAADRCRRCFSVAYVLEAGDLARYPPKARSLAMEHLVLLRKLPAAFAAVLLSTVIDYDWRFPAEQSDVDRQLAFLGGMDEAQLTATMAGFAGLSLSADLQAMRWGAGPAEFIEKMTAYLWSVHQMDGFRELAGAYQRALLQAEPEPLPAIPRLCVIVIGRDAMPGTMKLFQKLRPQGTYFNRVKATGSLDGLFAAVEARVKAHPAVYGHWYVDGGAPYEGRGLDNARDGLLGISYERLAPLRRALLEKVNTARTSGDAVGPENLRSLLATLKPGQLGAASSAQDAVRQHFELSLLTEGSGTQIFSTTFVQWAGRELLRRARPLTLVLRYAPRQAERSMNAMLTSDATGAQMDAAGSLVDADMGAYYTWVNLMRLTGAERASFVVWFEGQGEALAAGPAMARGAVSGTVCDLPQLLAFLN